MLWVTLVVAAILFLLLRTPKERRPRRPRETVEQREHAQFAYARGVEFDVDGSLASLAVERLHEVWVSDRRGRWTEIDHLALCGDRILVIETKGWKGRVWIDTASGQWHQIKPRETKIHQSPVTQSARQIAVLRSLYAAARFQPVILMPYADFGGDRPAEIWTLDALAAFVATHGQEETREGTRDAWTRLCELDRQQDKAALRAVRARHGRTGIAAGTQP